MSPARSSVVSSGTAGPVTRSAPDARRPRCRPAGVRTGCAPWPTPFHTPDTQPVPQPSGPNTTSNSPSAMTLSTTTPSTWWNHRSWRSTSATAVHDRGCVTLRGTSTESDPEPGFGRRRDQQ
jgi:hypothetical protein